MTKTKELKRLKKSKTKIKNLNLRRESRRIYNFNVKRRKKESLKSRNLKPIQLDKGGV